MSDALTNFRKCLSFVKGLSTSSPNVCQLKATRIIDRGEPLEEKITDTRPQQRKNEKNIFAIVVVLPLVRGDQEYQTHLSGKRIHRKDGKQHQEKPQGTNGYSNGYDSLPFRQRGNRENWSDLGTE